MAEPSGRKQAEAREHHGPDGSHRLPTGGDQELGADQAGGNLELFLLFLLLHILPGTVRQSA